jgi:hypothetical protein
VHGPCRVVHHQQLFPRAAASADLLLTIFSLDSCRVLWPPLGSSEGPGITTCGASIWP